MPNCESLKTINCLYESLSYSMHIRTICLKTWQHILHYWTIDLQLFLWCKRQLTWILAMAIYQFLMPYLGLFPEILGCIHSEWFKTFSVCITWEPPHLLILMFPILLSFSFEATKSGVFPPTSQPWLFLSRSPATSTFTSLWAVFRFHFTGPVHSVWENSTIPP